MTTPSDGRRRARDPRLDFFRGVGMFIILVAHIPWNPWTSWIPARFGFSDAAEMFVFCSGMASAIAFARVFDHHGWAVGTLRIVHRVWQVYWAHVGVFLVVAALMVAADRVAGGDHYVREELALGPFFAAPQDHLVGLLTLTWVPNYFDILPMYLAILAMIPAAMALARLGPVAVGIASVLLWGAAGADLVHLSADADTGRPWFFNPFAWQIVFFTGFAFMRGWIPAPPVDRRLVLACAVAVLLAMPFGCQDGFSCYAGFGAVPWLGRVHDGLGWWIDKTNEGPLRFVHFLATAYLAWVAVGPHGVRLRGPAVAVTRLVGRQTLAVFLTGLVVAQLAGMAMDGLGRSLGVSLAVNLAGCLVLVAAAAVAQIFKAPPWKHPQGDAGRQPGQAAPRPAPAPATADAAPRSSALALPPAPVSRGAPSG